MPYVDSEAHCGRRGHFVIRNGVQITTAKSVGVRAGVVYTGFYPNFPNPSPSTVLSLSAPYLRQNVSRLLVERRFGMVGLEGQNDYPRQGPIAAAKPFGRSLLVAAALRKEQAARRSIGSLNGCPVHEAGFDRFRNGISYRMRL